MRCILPVAVLAALLSGCATAPSPTDGPSDDVVSTAAVQPVDFHDVVDLTLGASKSWSFDVGPNATEVSIQFYGTGPQGTPIGGGMPLCLSYETPKGKDAAGTCQGSGVGNIQVSPYVVAVQRTFFHADGPDAPAGHYVFSMEAQQSATEFHALVHVAY